MAIDLRGKAIVITGASSGIGAATALACARAGMSVALGARRLDKLEALVAKLRQSGAAAICEPTDVTDPASCQRLVDRAKAELGGVYAVFANAGYGLEAPLHEMTGAQVRDMFEVNVFGSLNIIRPALAAILERAPKGDQAQQHPQRPAVPIGHVLWCSSCLAKLSIPQYGVYCATKSAQHHLGRAMRLELRPLGVEVATVHPIGTRTEFFDTAAKLSSSAKLLERGGQRFMQEPGVVAARVVACLKRPRPEVWTGLNGQLARVSLSLASFTPRISDALMSWAMNRRMR